MDNEITMDAIITTLSQVGAASPKKTGEICKAAVNILFAFCEEGARTPEEALDILHDYRLQAKQCAAIHRKHAVSGKPLWKDSVWHCPDCNRRVVPNHSFCHHCGKKLGWRKGG